MDRETCTLGTTMGARFDSKRQAITFCIYSRHASRIEVWFYDQPKDVEEIARMPLVRDSNGYWQLEVPLTRLIKANKKTADAVYYGYRAWGSNWPFDQAWQKGTAIGFVCDVDEDGNRFNPNKLLIDPYAVEISHDPQVRLSTIDPNECVAEYYSGPGSREIDTGRMAPKSILPLVPCDISTGCKPKRPLKDDIIYEVHVRGFTMLDSSIPKEYRGTYRGAALKADYLKALGVTAVELLPVFQFASEQNDDGDPRGDNYWGYMTLGYFAPNRRYSSDKSPGGPTREFQAMVKAFHDAGIKVLLDVVYNHTGEGLLRRLSDLDESRSADERQLPECACLLSLRGLDNASYYELRSRPDLDGGKRNFRYQDNSACGGNLNVANEVVQSLILDSLRRWSDELGVDGFRFDLAPVLGNCLAADGFVFDARAPNSLLRKMGEVLPVRSADASAGVDLIAEPWAVGKDKEDTYQLGHFPPCWAEWNDHYRKVMRRAENKLHRSTVPPWEMANALSGSAQRFRPAGGEEARPWRSVNYIASHDGYTLRDVFAYTAHDDSWDHGGVGAKQRKAVRNAFVLLMTSAGVPMFMGGDELFRSQGGCENSVALDNPSMYLGWENYRSYEKALAAKDAEALARLRQEDDIRIFEFAGAMTRFRNRYASLRPEDYFTGSDRSGTGIKDILWYRADGEELREAWNDSEVCFLGYRIDTCVDLEKTGVRSIYVAYNWNDIDVNIALPRNLPGARWLRVVDTAEWMEQSGNIDHGDVVIERTYGLHERSVAVFIEK